MSYGVNAPWGLRPMMKQGASTFDMTEQYPIASGQEGDIFTGDLVVLVNGYVKAITRSTTISDASFVLGVFMGCQYTVPTSANPTNPFQMNPMWTSKTATKNGADAIAYIITDTSVFFNIQANNDIGLPAAGDGPIIGAVANVTPAFGVDGVSVGNSMTGQSGLMLDYKSINNTIAAFNPALADSKNMLPLKIRGVVQVPGNTITTKTTVGIPYVNLIVSLNNTIFQTGQIAA